MVDEPLLRREQAELAERREASRPVRRDPNIEDKFDEMIQEQMKTLALEDEQR